MKDRTLLASKILEQLDTGDVFLVKWEHPLDEDHESINHYLRSIVDEVEIMYKALQRIAYPVVSFSDDCDAMREEVLANSIKIARAALDEIGGP